MQRFTRARAARRAITLMLMTAGTACTSVDVARLPTQRLQGDIFITQESVNVPYDSLGVVQVTRKGVLLFGFADPAGTDLAAALEELEPQIRRAGADGVMNARFEGTQYNTGARILGLIFFFAPLPSQVTVTGELVRFKRGGAMPVPAQGVPL